MLSAESLGAHGGRACSPRQSAPLPPVRYLLRGQVVLKHTLILCPEPVNSGPQGHQGLSGGPIR